MKEISKYIIGIIIGVLIVLLLAKPRYDNHIRTVNELDSIRLANDSLVNSINNMYNYYDSILSNSDRRLDSLKLVKNKQIKSYEEHIKNLRDVTIVSDDSITRYISNRIYNR